MQIAPLIDSPPTPARRPFVKLGNAIAFICTQLAAFALCVIVLVCTINVIGRYVFSHAFSWAEELMVFASIFAIFMGSAAVTWRAQHMHLDMLLRKFPLSMQKAIVVLSLGGSGLTLIFVSSLSWEVVSRLLRYGQLSDALEIPMWIPQSFVMIGFFLNGFLMLLRLFAFEPLPTVHDIEAEAEEAQL